MISKFRVRNFRSIVDSTFDFSYAEGKAPAHFETMSSYPFLQPEGNTKTRLVPCLALFGANASGKSNILKALSTITYIANDSNITSVYDPNLLHPAEKTTLFEIFFFADGSEYTYLVEYNADELLHEKLSVHDGVSEKKKILFEITKLKGIFAEVATEIYPESKLQEILRVECSVARSEHKNSLFVDAVPSICLGVQKRSFLSVIGQNYSGLNKSVQSVSKFFSTRFFYLPVNLRGQLTPMLLGLLSATGNYEKPENVLAAVSSMLIKMDIGIKQLSLRPAIPSGDSETPETGHRLTASHVNDLGTEVEFDFRQESDGTQVLCCLSLLVLFALQAGSVLVVDELDKSLHPVLQRELIRLFKDKDRNPKQAQLIFTAHNTDILDGNRLRISEVGIVNKTPMKGTTCKRLVEFDGIRNITNFRKQYLDGAFDGIPFPYI